MQEGDVVLTPVAQANGTIKIRPAVILREMRPYGDLLVCGISTQLHQQVQDFDEVIVPADADFRMSGLVSASLIRLGFVSVLPRSNIAGTIGSISAESHMRLLKALSDYLIM